MILQLRELRQTKQVFNINKERWLGGRKRKSHLALHEDTALELSRVREYPTLTIPHLKDIRKAHNPDIILLVETKHDDTYMLIT